MTYTKKIIIFLLFLSAIITYDATEHTFCPYCFSFFWFFPVLVMVLLPAISLSWFGQSQRISLSPVFKSKQVAEPEEIETCLGFLLRFGKMSILLGFTGAVAGVIKLFLGLGEPEKIGPAAAFIFLSMFYGTLFKILSYSAQGSLNRKYIIDSSIADNQRDILLTLGYPIIGLMSFFILLFSLS